MNRKINILPKIILIVFLLFVRLVAQEEEIHISHLTAEDGLSLSQVTQIFQDDKGFIWLGTYAGLNRYDGYNFKIYLPVPGDPGSISSHHITSIFQDSKGFLWIGTNNGLNRFDYKTETFKKYLHNANDSKSISHNLIYSMIEDKSGTLWVGTHNRLNKYDREKDNFSQVKISRDSRQRPSLLSVNTESICCMLQDYKRNLWLGTYNGLVNIETNGKVIHQFFDEEGNRESGGHKSITTIFEDKSKFLWVGTDGDGLYKYDPITGKFAHYFSTKGDPSTLSNDYINTIFQDNSNNLWIGTKNGLNKYDPQNNNFKRIFNDPEKPLSIINNEIMCINQDRSGLLWVGSFGGVSRFYNSSNKFANIQKNNYNDNVSLSNNKINSLYVDKKQNIWIGTLDGLDKIISDKSRIIHFRNDPKNKNSICDNYISTIIEDHLGYMWIGTNQNGLNRINPSTGENKVFLHQNDDPASLSNTGINDVIEDHTGTIWVGTWYGLNRYNRSTESFFRYENIPDDPKSLSHNLVWDIFEDSKHLLWVGTDGGGVCVLNPKISAFTTYMHDSTNANSLSDNRVFTLAGSKDGLIWIGTYNGLNCFDSKTGKFTIYKKENGLPGNNIFSIQEDLEGLMWIGTDKGLSCFNRKVGIFTNYSKKDGLKELEFSARACAITKDGKLYFGSKAGLLLFDPKEIKDKSAKAPIVFTDLKLYNQSVPISQNNNSILNESISISKSITLPSASDVITIDFALLYYLNVRGNTYQYKLDGFEKNWNDVGRRNSATYTNLPPGQYTFIVNAFNTDGTKGEKAAQLEIIIVPSYYQTWWFRGILALGILLLTFVFFQQRTKKIKKQNKLLEGYVTERTKDLDKTITELNLEVLERKKAEENVHAALEEKDGLLHEKEILLKEIHHRVKNNLQVISSLLYLQSRTIKDAELLSMFDDSRNRIRSMALIHEKLYQSNGFSEINLFEYVDSLLTQLKKSFRSVELMVKNYILIDHDIKFNLDTAMSCGLIINELMTNAFKYAFPPNWVAQQASNYEFKIEIRAIKEDNNRYSLIVSDNGVGIAEGFDAEKAESLGLKIVTTMVTQIGGSMEIKRDEGTKFLINFPYYK